MRIRELFDFFAAASVGNYERRLEVPPEDDLFFELFVAANLTVEDLYAHTESETEKRERDLARQSARLEDLNADLRAANRRLDTFAYTVGHDLKEPLRGIRAGSEALAEELEGQLTPAAQEGLDRITHSVGRLQCMLDALLEISRKGRAEVAPEEVPLLEVVDQAIGSVSQTAKERDADIRVEGPLPTIMGQRVELEQVFTNLFANAVRYNDKPDPRVVVRAEKGPRAWRIAVEDNGPGVPPAYQERIFQLFKRGPTQRTQGTGAGLAIVRRIVEAHRGRVWVESRGDGTGSIFWVELPRAA